MQRTKWIRIVLLSMLFRPVAAQEVKIDDKRFFEDDRPIEMTLSVNMKQLLAARDDLDYVPARITCTFPDSTRAEGEVRVKHRGKFRKENCRLASLTIDFKNKTSPAFSKLGTLKFAGACNATRNAEQFLMKEYLVYKIYNLITDMSFRVRLAHVSYVDTEEKQKTYSQFAFLIEDIDDLARRNKCREKENVRFPSDYFNREQTTILYLFQYMIGNTDWSIPFYHNIKLIVDRSDTLGKPYPVPYDFDVTGVVNPPYGVPPPNLGIKSLTQRLYRGTTRTPEEIESALGPFFEQEDSIYKLIGNFDALEDKKKKDMIRFLEDFFSEAKNKKEQKRIFVDNARKE